METYKKPGKAELEKDIVLCVSAMLCSVDTIKQWKVKGSFSAGKTNLSLVDFDLRGTEESSRAWKLGDVWTTI